MPIDPHAGKTEQARINTAQALELRLRGLPYRRIADAMGINVKTAYRYVSQELAKINAECREKAEELQTIELERLDDAIARVAASEAYRAGEPQSVNTYIRLSESRRKLLGLDAPVKQDLTSGGEKITTFNVVIPSNDPDG